MKWAILQWHPSMTGASWVKGVYWLKEGSKQRSVVLTFDSKEAAQEAAANMAHYCDGIGGLEVLEYN